MKLAAIYNAWDGVELLEASMVQLYASVDMVIIVYQEVSNFGENWSPLPEIEWMLGMDKISFIKYEPSIEMGGAMNERKKRNLGIEHARMNGCTHFLAIDVDEIYADFESCKQQYINAGHAGSVCRLQTYFKKPTFRFDIPEDYFVPFIHELKEDTKSGASSYKFYVDPTRTVNESDVIELPFFMHHYSWCRLNIMRKARNSSAKIQIEKGGILKDYNSPDLGEGYFLTNWNRRIKVVPDQFQLLEIFDQS